MNTGGIVTEEAKSITSAERSHVMAIFLGMDKKKFEKIITEITHIKNNKPL